MKTSLFNIQLKMVTIVSNFSGVLTSFIQMVCANSIHLNHFRRIYCQKQIMKKMKKTKNNYGKITIRRNRGILVFNIF